MFCQDCGSRLPKGARFCIKCGVTIEYGDEDENPSASKKTRVTPAPTTRLNKTASTAPNNKPDFKKYVDNRVRELTEYNSAEELLDSKVSLLFVWLWFAITEALVILLCIIRKQEPLACILILAIFLIPAYCGAEVTAFIKRFKFNEKFYGRTKANIGASELVEFLNTHMSCFSSHFYEWEIYRLYSGDDMSDKTDAIIATGFGDSGKIIARIYIKPEEPDGDSEYTEYSFDISPTMIGAPLFSAYKGAVRAVPIMYAAIEYYLLF